MDNLYEQAGSIKNKKNLFENVKTKQIFLGASVFIFVVLVYFISINYIDSSDTEVVIDSKEDKTVLEKKIAVHVSGAVEKPGVYEMENKDRVVDVISKAGGILASSSKNWVTKELNLATILTDQQKIYVPFEWEKNSSSVTEVAEISNKKTSTIEVGSKEIKTDEKVNINKASKASLEDLPGIGEVYAQKIIDNRPYTNLEGLKEKTDIYESTIEKFAKLIGFN